MRTRSLLRAAFDIGRTPPPLPPPTFLLPCRARLHQAAASSPTQFQSSHSEIPPQSAGSPFDKTANSEAQDMARTPETNFQPTDIPLAPGLIRSIADHALRRQPVRLNHPLQRARLPLRPSEPRGKPLVLSKSLQTLLPLLQAQKPHYISAHLHRFPYLLTPGDTVRLPFHMHGVNPGDVLRLNRASLLGSRDYTLKAGTTSTELYDGTRTGEPNYLDERLFECRVRVLGLDSGPMMIKEKTKRRQRRVKTVRSKHKFTALKVMEVKVKSLEELEGEAEQLILE